MGFIRLDLVYDFVEISLLQRDCSKSSSDHRCGEKAQRRNRIVCNSTFVSNSPLLPVVRTIIENWWQFVNPYQLIQWLKLCRINCPLIWTFFRFHICKCCVISCFIYQFVLQLFLQASLRFRITGKFSYSDYSSDLFTLNSGLPFAMESLLLSTTQYTLVFVQRNTHSNHETNQINQSRKLLKL